MQEFINKFRNNKIFDELYVLILAFIILLSWNFFFTYGTVIVIVLATAVMLILNNFKYLIPAGLFFIYSNRSGFTEKLPIDLVICFAVLLVAVIYYMIRNKDKINLLNNKSFWGLSLLSMSVFLPIFWANLDDKSSIYYLLYLSYGLYFVIYFMFATNLDDKAFLMFKKSIIFLGIILAFECMIEIYTLKVNYPDLVLSSITFYSLGWGCCNEAGIMMLMCFPFIFMDFVRYSKLSFNIVSTIKILIVGLGVIFTYSRGAYLFGFFELAFLTIYTFFKAKNRKTYSILMSSLGLLLIVSVQAVFGWPTFFNDILINGVFDEKLNDTNRFELWSNAFNIYKRDYVTMTFGSGIVSEFAMSNVRNGMALAQVVYHSTLFEILVSAGNFGLAFMIVHISEKYMNLCSAIKKTHVLVYMFTSYLVVDLYGLIDNTYGMYYYMIPLVIMMASFDSFRYSGDGYYE